MQGTDWAQFVSDPYHLVKLQLTFFALEHQFSIEIITIHFSSLKRTPNALPTVALIKPGKQKPDPVALI